MPAQNHMSLLWLDTSVKEFRATNRVLSYDSIERPVLRRCEC